MDLSVVVCTWNRAALLRQTLANFCDLRVPENAKWEIVVVDNGSTDGTPAVVAAVKDRLPIRHVLEPVLGLSQARNTGASEARGEIVFFTDDDVQADPDIVTAYLQAARRWPDAGYFGGRILPWFECDPPPWYLKNLDILSGIAVIRDLGGEERIFAKGEIPWGPNMAFRKSVFGRCSFNTTMGRKGNEQIRNSETSILADLQANEVQGVWVPDAQVKHFIASRQMTPQYIWQHSFGLGRANVRLYGSPKGRIVLGAPLWLRRQAVALLWRSRWERILQKDGWIQSFKNAAYANGQLQECRESSRKGQA